MVGCPSTPLAGDMERCSMAYLQYFGAGLTTLGVMTVILSFVSPDRSSPGTVLVGVVAFFVGVVVLVLAGRGDSRMG